MIPIDPHIFRAYDIRGKAGSQITEDACEQIGYAFGVIVKERYKVDHPKIVVGRDARTHSAGFDQAVTIGLLAAGCHVLSIGPTPSPVNYFTIVTQKLDGGIQITASHNPGTDNGLKLQVRDAEAFSGDDLQELRVRIERGTKRTANSDPTSPRLRGASQRTEDELTADRPLVARFASGDSSLTAINAVDPYFDHYSTLFDGMGRGLSIVTDCGNGIAGPVNNAILRKIGCRITDLYSEPDGTFPNHLADPSKWDTLKELQEGIIKTKADGGLAFDGDGDRVGLVDELGKIHTADEMLLLLAKRYLQKFPDSPVVFTTSMSSTLVTEIAKWGGKPVMCAVGHSVVEHTMRHEGAPLGGEQSGHFFLKDVAYGYDDALAVALVLIAIRHDEGKPFSELFKEFPTVFHAPELRPHCADGEKTRIIESITKHFSTLYPVNTMDGARIDFGDGAWANIRQSNTAPKLSVCLEARSEKKLEDITEIVLRELRTYKEIEL
ncbi:MAG: phosphomannomutase/phosphoglucomutase [Candidatus Peribacteraceae bacterium]|nr:phosphomannomutase/phosphoglucomutase [Candidatus Peribacteraceae bacterium]